MKHNERVQAIAGEMATDQYFKEYGPHSTLNDTANKSLWIEKFIPQARIAVKHMAAAVKESCMDVAWWELTPYLLQNGLLPEDSEDAKEWREYLKQKGLMSEQEAAGDERTL